MRVRVRGVVSARRVVCAGGPAFLTRVMVPTGGSTPDAVHLTIGVSRAREGVPYAPILVLGSPESSTWSGRQEFDDRLSSRTPESVRRNSDLRTDVRLARTMGAATVRSALEGVRTSWKRCSGAWDTVARDRVPRQREAVILSSRRDAVSAVRHQVARRESHQYIRQAVGEPMASRATAGRTAGLSRFSAHSPQHRLSQVALSSTRQRDPWRAPGRRKREPDQSCMMSRWARQIVRRTQCERYSITGPNRHCRWASSFVVFAPMMPAPWDR